jgi:ABC-type antimicrobial peptide transport system permease subunit
VVAEVAMSMALVCAAWLMVKAYGGPGGGRPYEVSNNVLIANVSFSRREGDTPYSTARADAILSQARARIAARPSVRNVSVGNAHPQGEASPGYGFIASPQATSASSTEHASAALGVVDPEFFAAAGIRLRDGRDFSRSDSAGSARVAIVTPAAAARLWPGTTAVGKVLIVGQVTRAAGRAADTAFVSYSVIGIVDDIRSYAGVVTGSYGRPNGMVYVTRLQLSLTEGVRPSRDMTFIVRTDGDVREQASSIAQELRALDPSLVISGVRSTRQRRAEQGQEEIAMANGISLAGVVALFMACVGVYAVIAFGVSQRTREIGIRMALGARRSQVVSLFFREGMRLALFGFVIGIPLSLLAMKLALGRESDKILTVGSVVTVVIGLLAVAAMASWLPARRAAGVDPMNAARSE